MSHIAHLESGETVELREFDSLAAGPRQSAVERNVAFRCINSRLMTWQEICNLWIPRFEGLLWLATGAPSAIIRFEMVIPNANGVDWQTHRLWASLIQPKSSPGPRRPEGYLFTAQTFPGGFEEGITNWFQIMAKLKNVIQPLVARDHSPFIFGEDRLLTAVAAFDAYSNKKQTPSSARELRKNRIAQLKALVEHESEEFRIWANEAAQNQRTEPLRNRMSSILTELPNVVEDLLGAHKEDFLTEVNRARNRQAHALKDKPTGSFHDQDGGLYFAAEALNWLLRAMLLIELDMPRREAEQAVQSSGSFKFVAKSLKPIMENFSTISG